MIVRGRNPATDDSWMVTIAGGRVADIRSCPAIGQEPWLTAGLVDLQLNGFAGIDLNDGRCGPSQVVALCHAVVRTGTTTFLPTLITAPHASLIRAARAIGEACEADSFAAHLIAGIHLEGPSISPIEGYRGAHPEAWVRPPSLEELLEVHHASGDRVRLVTLSPHWERAPACIRGLKARGIACAIGHTHANASQIAAAVDAGACLSTHLGNALPLSMLRHENPLWPQLADARLNISLIADGIHLPPEVLRVMLQAKNPSRCVLISDAVAYAGMPAGAYHAAIGGDVLVGEDSSVRMQSTGLLAGSGISLLTAVARCASMTCATLSEALAMASANPARLLGLARGEIAVGASADLITFRCEPGEPTLSLEQVIVRGQRLEHHPSLESA